MELLTVNELSKIIKYTPDKIRRMVRQKQLPFCRLADITGGEIRFDKDAIEAWVRGRIIEDSGFAPTPPPRRGRPPKDKPENASSTEPGKLTW